MIERLQHQLAAAAPPGFGPQRAFPIEHAGDDAVIVDAEPGAPGLPVEAAHHFLAIRPMAPGRQPRALRHFIAVGRDDDGPAMLGPTQDDQRAHGVSIPKLGRCRYNLGPSAGGPTSVPLAE